MKNLKYNSENIKIEKTELIKNSILIKNNMEQKSLLDCDNDHIFYLLKSYSSDNQGLVKSIYFVLNDDVSKPDYLYKIKLNHINSLKEINMFSEWWDKISLKLSDYETEEKKTNLLVHLNKENILNKFPELSEFAYLQPDPFKKKSIKIDLKNLSLVLNLFFIIMIICVYLF